MHIDGDRVYLAHTGPLLVMEVPVEVGVKPAKSRDKHQKFRALAESRTNKAIEAILRIGNLSNRQLYEFEETEVRKIVRALRDAITAVEGRFDSPRGKGNGGFKL